MTFVPPHWIRPNESSRLPRCFITLDVEARRDRVPGGERQTFALAVASHDCLKPHGRGPRPTEWAGFETPEALWEWIDVRTMARGRTVLVAHNLAYDLRVGDGLAQLSRLGWTMKMLRLDGGQTWGSFRRGDRTLTLVDSHSWLPAGLEKLALLVDQRKPPLPEDWQDTAALLYRCIGDVVTLRECWLRVMRWLEAADMGTFKPTGAGMAWAAWRHKFYGRRVLVHADQEAKDAERRAAWTGRCEAWRWGKQGARVFHEWDFEAAYATVARDHDLPERLVSSSTHLPLDAWRRIRRHKAILSEVTITTAVPTVPARVGEFIAWPVGTFTTTLWDCELSMALDHGATVEIGRSWFYAKGPALQDWATWVLDTLHLPEGDIDPIIRLVVKHWSRALIGRMASRWAPWSLIGEAPSDDVSLSRIGGPAAGSSTRLLQIGRQLWTDGAAVDAPDGVPQVMSYIMALSRVQLWGAIQTAGPENVLYMDTDSLITTAAGSRNLQQAGVTGLRIKAKWPHLELLGPRQLIVGGQLRAAGVPGNATFEGGRTWAGEVWTQLSTSIALGDAAAVTIQPRTWQVKGVDNRRRHLPNGDTEPFTLP